MTVHKASLIILVMFLWAVCFPLIVAGFAYAPHLTFATLRAFLAGAALVFIGLALCWLSLKTDPVLSPRFDPLSRYALLVMMWSMLVSPFVSVSPFRSWL